MKKCKIINLYAGPGTGKSTSAAGLFAELKLRGVNCEYIQEYAKDAAWEKRGPKVFESQEYIFGKQHFRMARVADDVELLVTDSPISLGLVYMPKNFKLPSLKLVIREAYDLYDNLDISLVRRKKYENAGRLQNEAEARQLDQDIFSMLDEQQIYHTSIDAGRNTTSEILKLMVLKWPELQEQLGVKA